MRAEDLLTRAPSAEAVARETQKLPEPSAEARESLRQVLESSARPAPSTPWPALLTEARGKMDSRHAGPVTSHRGGLTGPALVLAKRAFRLVFQPFINEALRKQVEFNESILDALATLHDVQREHARTQATWRQDVERRLARIEEAARDPSARAAPVSHEGGTPSGGDTVPSSSSTRDGGQSGRSGLAPRGDDARSGHASRDLGVGADTPRASHETRGSRGDDTTPPSPLAVDPATTGTGATAPHSSSGTSRRRRSGKR